MVRPLEACSGVGAVMRKTRLRRRGKGTIKNALLDALWSRVVRLRGGHRCIMAGCGHTTQGCHIFPKGSYPSLRHNPENGFAACWYHHLGPKSWHKDPSVQRQILDILIAQRGQAWWDMLQLRSKLTGTKPDRAAIKLALERELK